MNPENIENWQSARGAARQAAYMIEAAYQHASDNNPQAAIASALIAIALELRRLNNSRDQEYEEEAQRAEIREQIANFWK